MIGLHVKVSPNAVDSFPKSCPSGPSVFSRKRTSFKVYLPPHVSSSPLPSKSSLTVKPVIASSISTHHFAKSSLMNCTQYDAVWGHVGISFALVLVCSIANVSCNNASQVILWHHLRWLFFGGIVPIRASTGLQKYYQSLGKYFLWKVKLSLTLSFCNWSAACYIRKSSINHF